MLQGDKSTLRKARGNINADKAADMGRLLHPSPTEQQAKELEGIAEHAKIAVRVLAATLPLWPRLERTKEKESV